MFGLVCKVHKLQKVSVNFVMPVCMEQLAFHVPVFMKFCNG